MFLLPVMEKLPSGAEKGAWRLLWMEWVWGQREQAPSCTEPVPLPCFTIFLLYNSTQVGLEGIFMFTASLVTGGEGEQDQKEYTALFHVVSYQH